MHPKKNPDDECLQDTARAQTEQGYHYRANLICSHQFDVKRQTGLSSIPDNTRVTTRVSLAETEEVSHAWSRSSVNAPSPPFCDLQQSPHQDPGIYAMTDLIFVQQPEKVSILSARDSRSAANRWVNSGVPTALSSRCRSCSVYASNDFLWWSCFWYSDTSPLARVSPTKFFESLSTTLKIPRVYSVSFSVNRCARVTSCALFDHLCNLLLLTLIFLVGIGIALATTCQGSALLRYLLHGSVGAGAIKRHSPLPGASTAAPLPDQCGVPVGDVKKPHSHSYVAQYAA